MNLNFNTQNDGPNSYWDPDRDKALLGIQEYITETRLINDPYLKYHFFKMPLLELEILRTLFADTADFVRLDNIHEKLSNVRGLNLFVEGSFFESTTPGVFLMSSTGYSITMEPTTPEINRAILDFLAVFRITGTHLDFDNPFMTQKLYL